ncbi:MAG TPA: hypothetical protein VIL12_05135 [Acidimicrobiia bacterium]
MSDEQPARVVPAVPSFAVDRGFSYLAPADVPLGTIVRVPLGGRVVRGFVVGPGVGDPKLKRIRSISGHRPVFDSRLLEVLRWAASHYVAPLAAVLTRAAPPNLPPQDLVGPRGTVQWHGASSMPEVAEAAAAGRHLIPHYLLGARSHADEVAGLAAPALASGRSVMVVVATAVEATELARGLVHRLGAVVEVVTPDASDRATTAAWSRVASAGGYLLVGTPRVALWPVERLALTIVIEEGRRAMKERQTPTMHVRDVTARRAVIQRTALAYLGTVPTGEVVAGGVSVRRAAGSGRGWPLVEVVDRRDDPFDRGVLGRRSRLAIKATVDSGGRVFLFSHRRGYSPASRCRICGELRVCPSCGSRPDPGPSCSRCGSPLEGCARCGGRAFSPLGAGVERVAEEARRLVGAERVGERGPVVAGTERDLVGAPAFDLSIVVDADGLVLGTNYRAPEEALRSLARVASAVGPGRGRRCMVQTMQATHPVVEALRRGDPLPFLEAELESRTANGLPPSGELIAVETRGQSALFAGELREAVAGEGSVLGPAETGGGVRWLIQGTRLGGVRLRLRDVVQRARDAGAQVRVDVDPIDL